MRVPRPVPLFIIAAVLCALSACSWVDRYSETACQQLLTLRQRHLQFIATAATNNERQLEEEDEQIRPLFAQAISQGDALRRDNFKQLEANYLRIYACRQKMGTPFTPTETRFLSQQTNYLYQQAIAGERQRPGRE
ncbi:hypothetical protein NOM74_22920 [Klebsiella quasipneumoniae]|uniref:hypothetical protein n=1 Tax=Klebsiella quasipneumoniae TaxID=1463165 RepID=UPI001299568B|nr:hypothetical protein [Klebsiella quasipneumoniae]MCS6747459.1 hypothetical protein [Klebsiella quasipneumoniae]MRE40879.1 hypothetical protein [Klebsiella quasipneumoniae]MRF91564.1 hypothetical protein [Klebsiella quasipneumoniae]HCI6433905.1 hypothetical protein [Klebsiella quasipneumoniae subsp. similipneumoniae]